MPGSAISRREARRAAVFLLFQWDVTGRPLGSLYEGEVDDYTRQLAEAVTRARGRARRAHHVGSDDWTADRLGAVERNVLRVALEELDEGEVPLEVVARRGGHACEALRVRGRCEAGERDPGQARAGGADD